MNADAPEQLAVHALHHDPAVLEAMERIYVRRASGPDLLELYARWLERQPPASQDHALRVALFFGTFQALMPVAGWFAGGALKGTIANAAHWAAFNMWHVGGTVIVQSRVDTLDPHDIWSTVEKEKAESVRSGAKRASDTCSPR